MNRIFKFGGTSMAATHKVVDIITSYRKENPNKGLGIVVSAVGKTTNNLRGMIENPEKMESFKQTIVEQHSIISDFIGAENAKQFMEDNILPVLKKAEDIICSGNLTNKEKAEINSFGEVMSHNFLSTILSHLGFENSTVDSGTLIATRGESYLGDRCHFDKTKAACESNLFPLLNEGKLAVITGYYGLNDNGEVSTLGRNSSDTISAIVGAFTQSEDVTIWTDVDGIYSDNPNGSDHKVVKLPHVGIGEMLEASSKGASVVHKKVLDFLLDMMAYGYDIPAIEIKNTHEPEVTGSFIVEEPTKGVKFVLDGGTERKISIRNYKMIGQAGFSADVFKIMKDREIPVDVIMTSDASISFSLSPHAFDIYQQHHESLLEQLEGEGSVVIKDSVRKLMVIGFGAHEIEVSQKILSCAAASGVNLLYHSAQNQEETLNGIVTMLLCEKSEIEKVANDNFLKKLAETLL